jgi:hypothetical protein
MALISESGGSKEKDNQEWIFCRQELGSQRVLSDQPKSSPSIIMSGNFYSVLLSSCPMQRPVHQQ